MKPTVGMKRRRDGESYVEAVHPVAAVGFERGAEAYERGRPGYPAAAVAWLAAELGLGVSSVVVDLAAGTGKLSRLLVPTGARVIAVEPVAGMRAMLASLADGVEVLAGTAESMPLPDRSADAVTIAHALHWFDIDRAAPEIHRVLRPTGRVAVVYNRRDLSQRIHQEVDRIIGPYRGDIPIDRYDRWLTDFGATPLFRATTVREFPNQQELTVEGVLDRIFSTSFVAALPEAERQRVDAELRDVVSGVEKPVVLRYRTQVYIYDPA
jgi:ubiquinone/menaquinone biosynthesis C-methylase UbiE